MLDMYNQNPFKGHVMLDMDTQTHQEEEEEKQTLRYAQTVKS